MPKLVIAIEPQPDEPAFETAWPQFLHLAEQMPGVIRETTTRLVSPIFRAFPFVMIHELHFDQKSDLESALNSPQGKEAGRVLQTITGGRLSIAVCDHTEDDLANIARYTGSALDE